MNDKTTPHPELPAVLSGCDASLEEMEQRVRCNTTLLFALNALERGIKNIKSRRNDWYDKYMPMFMLLGAYNASDKLNQLITIVEEDFFNRFYSELSQVYAHVVSPQLLKTLPTRDAYSIQRLEKERKKRK